MNLTNGNNNCHKYKRTKIHYRNSQCVYSVSCSSGLHNRTSERGVLSYRSDLNWTSIYSKCFWTRFQVVVNHSDAGIILVLIVSVHAVWFALNVVTERHKPLTGDWPRNETLSLSLREAQRRTHAKFNNILWPNVSKRRMSRTRMLWTRRIRGIHANRRKLKMKLSVYLYEKHKDALAQPSITLYNRARLRFQCQELDCYNIGEYAVIMQTGEN